MLQFSTTPALIATGIAVWLAVAVFSFLIWTRSPHPARTAAVEALRLLIAALLVALLWKPQWRRIIEPDAKPEIAVLWDASGSMATLDAALPAEISAAREVVTRAAWVERFISPEVWQALEVGGKNTITIAPFAKPAAATAGNPAPPAGTDLEAPLSALLESGKNLRAAVVFSDGDYNLGQPPIVAAQKFQLRGVPVFTIPVGSKARLPDLELLAVSAPAYGITGENVQIPFTIRSSLDRQVRTIIRLRDETGREQTKDIILPPNADTYESIVWRLRKEGSSKLELSFPIAPGERVAANNAREFHISAKPEKLRVLLVETLPRWEYRFLHNALSRDPGVDVSCLLLHPQLGPGGGKDYIGKFPEKPEELAAYDVIFLGDVGVAPGQLTQEQCALIRGLVEHQASGLVFLPGPQGNQRSLAGTELADLLPIVPDDGSPQGLAEAVPAPLTLTTEGRASLLTMLGENEEQNPAIWRRLPGFYWHAAVVKAQGGAETLAVHGSRRGKFGPIPLIVTKPAGNGKVLFMGIDSAWRWRRGVEDLYHYRFWGQVARWMSYQRNMAAGQNIRLFFTPERPAPGTNVTVNANAFDTNGAPLRDGTVMLDVTPPGGAPARIALRKNESSWGAFSGRFKVDRPGEWQLTAISSTTPEKPLHATLSAQGTEIEKTGQPARPEVLEEIARITRGRVVPPEQISALVREISALPQPRPLETRFPLWSHWLTLTTLVSLLAAFWIARKLTGAF